MKLVSIKLYGEIAGTIWMPAAECTKDFNVTFTPQDRPFTKKWSGMRDALLDITNDGDFQSCGIVYCGCNVEYVDAPDNGHVATHTVKSCFIEPCKAIADLFA